MNKLEYENNLDRYRKKGQYDFIKLPKRHKEDIFFAVIHGVTVGIITGLVIGVLIVYLIMRW